MIKQTIYLPETIFSVAGVPLDDCNLTCVKTGEVLDIDINQPFLVPSLAITDANTATNSITLEYGDWSGYFNIGSVYVISGSTANNGTYVVTNISVAHIGNNLITTISFDLEQPLADNSPDGYITLPNSWICNPDSRKVEISIYDGDSLQLLASYNYIDTDSLMLIKDSIAYTFNQYQNLKVVYTASDCLNSVTRTYELRACINYSVTKKSCHNYIISDSDTVSLNKVSVITITNINGAYSRVYTMISNSAATSLNISLPEDGVYNVSITNNLTTVVVSFPLYDLCDMTYCLRHMILEVLCNDDNPCDDCGQGIAAVDYISKHKDAFSVPGSSVKMTSEQRRAELNKVIALGSQLLAQIKYQELTSIGINYPNSQVHLKMIRINSIFDKINAIIKRCGHCSGTSNKRWNNI